MHNGERAFVAKFPNLTTIRPKRAGVSIGQQSYLTKLDVKQIIFITTVQITLTNFVGPEIDE